MLGLWFTCVARLQTVLNTMCGFGMQALHSSAAARDISTVGCLEKILGWTRTNMVLVAGLTAGLLLLEVTRYFTGRCHGIRESRLCFHRCVSPVWPPLRSPSSTKSGSTRRTENLAAERRRSGRRASGFPPLPTSQSSERGACPRLRGAGLWEDPR